MLENKQILVAGGDMRSISLSKLLAVRNTVFTLGLENENIKNVKSATIKELQQLPLPLDYIILPMPAIDDAGNILTPLSKEELPSSVLLSLCGGQTHVLGGKLNESIRKKMDNLRIGYTDYLLREELAIKNAVPTAEGAIEIAQKELNETLWQLPALIIGYGRIGRVLASRLKALGANITVTARRFSDLAWIEVDGYHCTHTCEIESIADNFRLVINTVPALVLPEAVLSRLKRDCLIIDLASKPGGVDFETAKRLNLNTIWALSLPGKCAPKTAGKVIYDTIQNIDSERRYSLE